MRVLVGCRTHGWRDERSQIWYDYSLLQYQNTMKRDLLSFGTQLEHFVLYGGCLDFQNVIPVE